MHHWSDFRTAPRCCQLSAHDLDSRRQRRTTTVQWQPNRPPTGRPARSQRFRGRGRIMRLCRSPKSTYVCIFSIADGIDLWSLPIAVRQPLYRQLRSERRAAFPFALPFSLASASASAGRPAAATGLCPGLYHELAGSPSACARAGSSARSISASASASAAASSAAATDSAHARSVQRHHPRSGHTANR